MKNFIDTVYGLGLIIGGLLIGALLFCIVMCALGLPFLLPAWLVVAFSGWAGCDTYMICSALAVVFAGFALMLFACGGRG